MRGVAVSGRRQRGRFCSIPNAGSLRRRLQACDANARMDAVGSKRPTSHGRGGASPSCRAALYQAILRSEPRAGENVKEALDFLRRAGSQDHLPYGLLTRALFRATTGDFDGAREDLDEAFEIAERGPKRLISPTSISIACGCSGSWPAGRRTTLGLGARRSRRGSQAHRDLRLRPPARGARRRRGGVGAHLRNHRARWLLTGLTRAAKRLTIVRVFHSARVVILFFQTKARREGRLPLISVLKRKLGSAMSSGEGRDE